MSRTLGLGLGSGLGLDRYPGARTRTPTEITTDWVNRVIANGGTVSAGTQTAVQTFVTTMYSLGIWGRFLRVNLFCGDQLAACLTPLVSGPGFATDTNVNFIAGDYVENLGLHGDGVSAYLNTGVIVPNVSGRARGGLTWDSLTNLIATSDVFIGAQSTVPAGDTQFSKTNVGSMQQSVFGGGSSASVGFQLTGLWRATRKSDTNNQMSKDGVLVASSAGLNTGANAAVALYVFAKNLDGVADNYVDAVCRCGGYAIDDGTIPDEHEAAFSTAWTVFRTALGR